MDDIKSIINDSSDQFLQSEKCAILLDEQDELKSFREEFCYPPKDRDDPKSVDCIYLCGNSLGLQPKKLKQRIKEELYDWATLGVEGHFKGKYPWVSTDEPLLPHVCIQISFYYFHALLFLIDNF